jgi:O-antigen/teichoic acid export membrane protein
VHKNLLKNTALYGIVDFAFKFINFAMFPLYSFVLTVSEFGLFSLIATFTQILSIVMNCGQTQALQRFFSDKELTETQKTNVTITGLYCFGVPSAAFTVAVLILFYFYNPLQNIPLYLITLGILTALPYQIFQYALTFACSNFLSAKFVQLTILQNVLTIGFSLTFVLQLNLGILGFIAAPALASFLVFPFIFFALRKYFSGQFDIKLAKEMMIFGFPFVFTDIANWWYASIDRWMLAELSTTLEVGYYSMAFKIAGVLIFLIKAFGLAWTPYSMKLYRSDPNYRTFFSSSLTAWFFFLISFGTGISLFSQELLMLTTPEAYWPAARLIPWINLGIAFHGTLLLSVSGLLIEKKVHQLALGTWLCALANFALNLVLIPYLASLGAAITCLLTYMMQGLYFLYYSHKYHPLPLEYKKLGTCMLIGISVPIVCYFLTLQPWSYHLLAIKMLLFFFVLLAGFLTKVVSFPKVIQSLPQKISFEQ